MYVPSHQYIVKSTREIPTLRDKEGNIYTKATVVNISSGEYYDVPAEDLLLGVFTNAIRLFADEIDGNSPTIENITPKEYVIPSIVFTPTLTDIENGTITRYFIVNTSTGKVKEISKDNYEIKAKDKSLFEYIGKLDWRTEGPAEDIYINNRKYIGAASINKQAVESLNKEIPGLSTLITDYSQYVVPSIHENKGPIDRDSFYIPAPSKKL